MRSKSRLFLLCCAALCFCGCTNDKVIRLSNCTTAGDATTVTGTLTVIPAQSKEAGPIFILVDKQEVETMIKPDETSAKKLETLTGQHVTVTGRLSEIETLLPVSHDSTGRKVTSLRLLVTQAPDAQLEVEAGKLRLLRPCG